MTRSVRVLGCKDPGLEKDGSVGYVTLVLDDSSESQIELRFDLPDAAGPLIGRLLQMGNAQASALRAIGGQQAKVPIGVVPVEPQHFGLRLAGPGKVSLGLQFGSLNLMIPIPVGQLQAMADFLSAQARIAAGEPGRAQ